MIPLAYLSGGAEILGVLLGIVTMFLFLWLLDKVL